MEQINYCKINYLLKPNVSGASRFFLTSHTEGFKYFDLSVDSATVQTNVRTKTGSSLDKPEPIVQVRDWA